MLSVKNLCKTFGSRKAVNDLSLEVGAELFIFLGANGAGKTTSIKMMSGLLRPDLGTIHIMGISLLDQPLEAKRKIGLVQEHPALYEKLTAKEFVLFIAKLYRIPFADAHRRQHDLFEIFELSDRSNDLIEDLSHGMKQKVALCGALVHDPQVLFLDEPFVGLDPKAARQLKELLRGLVDKGTTVFMSTHVLEVAEKMCDRIGIIHEGKLIAQGTLEELAKDQKASRLSLEDIFLNLTGSATLEKVARYLETE
jgi:ABC-2 type transport system ATP-binding protein